MRSHTDNTATNDLRKRLEQERTEILELTRSRMRDVRAEGAAEADMVRDTMDESDADVQTDLEMALIALQSERLDRINLALDELDEGHYGLCVDCGIQIAPARLRALPFAVRCLDCQDIADVDVMDVAAHWPFSSRRHHGQR